jgi:hypothetical protein
MSSSDQENKQQPIRVNDEKGLQPAKNPPKMPEVKPPRSEGNN